MGKKKTCPKCGLEFEVSKKDAMLRKAVSLQAKMFPAMKEYAEAAKDYCNQCWKKTVKPAAKGILGAMAEEEGGLLLHLSSISIDVKTICFGERTVRKLRLEGKDYKFIETFEKQQMVSLDCTIEAVKEVVSQIRKKKINIEKLPYPDEFCPMTKIELAKQLNQEFDEVLALLEGSSEAKK